MREIKFRCYEPSTKIMFIPFSTPNPTTSPDRTGSILMQFTGLKDKNGKEIYEGDILIIPDEEKEHILDDGSGPIEPFNHLSQVIFKDGAFGIDVKDKGDILDDKFWSFDLLKFALGNDCQKELEVRGNVYENPELPCR